MLILYKLIIVTLTNALGTEDEVFNVGRVKITGNNRTQTFK